MKKLISTYILTFILITLLGGALYGQEKDTQKEDLVKAQKIAFFTEKLNLTSDEAQRFWPVYNEYWQKKNKIIDDRKTAMKFCSENMEKLSAKEIEKYGDMYISFHQKESDLLTEFNEKFKNVLPADKVMKLYLADYDFKTYLLRQIRDSKSQE